MSNRALAVLPALLLSLYSHMSQAESMGSGSVMDNRVQTAVYTPDNVFRVQSAIGRTSLIQFPAGETINEDSGLMAAGDPSAWSIGANKAGNLVQIKPITDQEPNTNLTISTNRRIYLLELKLVKRVQEATYVLRFTYPEAPKKPVVANTTPVDPCKGPVVNRSYQRRGDLSLSPTEVWDNGVFTCFRFAGGPRPVIYQVLPDGTETLANIDNKQNVAVVHSVSDLFRLRLNALVMEVRTQQRVSTGYNFNGTTTGQVREVKHAEQ